MKEAVVIDKDAIRTHFRVYDGEELVAKQKELSRLLKSAFHTCDRAAYYQGLNSVMGFLHRNIAEHKQVLEIFLGLINYQLSDFCHKEFDKCLVPVFNSAARILRDKHPNTNLGDLERMVNSRSRVHTSVCLCLGTHLVLHRVRRSKPEPSNLENLGLLSLFETQPVDILGSSSDPPPLPGRYTAGPSGGLDGVVTEDQSLLLHT